MANIETISIQVLNYSKYRLKRNIIIMFSYLSIVGQMCYSCMPTNQAKEDKLYNKLTNISCKQKEYDYGKILSENSVTTSFILINSGDNPLIIKQVLTSCGCTVPEWTKEEIKPNESGEIKIIYDAKHIGLFYKTITVVYNGEESLKLAIKGEVIDYKKKEITSFK